MTLLPPLEFVTAGGWSTPYRRMGTGRPVVLIHSLGGSLLSWDAIQPDLAGQAEVTVYDWGGHGSSEKPVEPFSMAELARQLADLIEQVVGVPALLYGVAAGAAIALQCAIDSPESVDGLVLGAPTSAVDPQTGARMRERVEVVRTGGMRAAVDGSIAAGFPADFRDSNPDVVARYRREFLCVAPAAYASCSDAFSRFEVTSRLGEVKAPVLLLPGVRDPYFPPPFAENMRRLRPDWEIRPLRGVGHYQHVQAPALVVDAVLFTLTSLTSQETPCG